MGTEDFIPIATKVLAKKPDAIHIFVTAWAPQEIRAIRQLGFKGPIISDTPLPLSIAIHIAGTEASTDLLCCGIYDLEPATKEGKEVMDLWAVKYKEPFVADAWMGWDNAWTLIQGMKKAQSIEPEKIVAALETMTKPGDIKTTFGDSNMGGLKRFGVNRVLMRPCTITHIMNGKPKILEKTLIQE
jgi:ABC-type branched-subunit amino acid transport system substrate-binding protein